MISGAPGLKWLIQFASSGAADEAAQRAFAARVSDDFRRRFNLTEGLLEALRDVERGRTGTGSAGG